MVVEHQGETAIGVAGGGQHRQVAPAEGHPVPLAQGQGHVLSAGLLRQADRAAGGALQQPGPAHVVGVNVGIERGHQRDAQLPDQGQIPTVLGKHRIDQHPLTADRIGQQVAVGAGVGIKALAQQQATRAGGSLQQGVGAGGLSGHGGHPIPGQA